LREAHRPNEGVSEGVLQEERRPDQRAAEGVSEGVLQEEHRPDQRETEGVSLEEEKGAGELKILSEAFFEAK
jgi:hypothetical protein